MVSALSMIVKNNSVYSYLDTMIGTNFYSFVFFPSVLFTLTHLPFLLYLSYYTVGFLSGVTIVYSPFKLSPANKCILN